jgi:three-Cys-motif partner protein
MTHTFGGSWTEEKLGVMRSYFALFAQALKKQRFEKWYIDAFPYGMQVHWSTLEALAATKAVDIALLFPTGPLTRMLTKDGKIPEPWEKRIDEHLGPCDWRSAFYKETEQIELFPSNSSELRKTMNSDRLRQFVFERLKSIFPFVCETQLELKNSRGAVLYHLFIICANPSQAAKALARRLAGHAVNRARASKR